MIFGDALDGRFNRCSAAIRFEIRLPKVIFRSMFLIGSHTLAFLQHDNCVFPIFNRKPHIGFPTTR
jgi:hypothetical protein